MSRYRCLSHLDSLTKVPERTVEVIAGKSPSIQRFTTSEAGETLCGERVVAIRVKATWARDSVEVVGDLTEDKVWGIQKKNWWVNQSIRFQFKKSKFTILK